MAIAEMTATVIKRLRPIDFVVFFLALLLLFASSLHIYRLQRQGGAWVHISSGQRQWRYPLENNGQYQVPGLLGESTISIENGRASIIDSPCANKTCIQAGTIERPGQWLACLPNAVFVKIEGRTDASQPDASSW